MEFCTLCDGPEKTYQPETEFICSKCVQILLGADQGDLQKAYDKAIRLGFLRKARAIESFLIERGNDEQRTNHRKLKPDNDRGRAIRVIRDQKKQAKRLEV